jgi:hypothetical protein
MSLMQKDECRREKKLGSDFHCYDDALLLKSLGLGYHQEEFTLLQ